MLTERKQMDKKRKQNRKDQQTLKDTDSVEIRTFGHFTVLINKVPVHFRRSKSKEILAFLIDKRGQTVSRQVIANEVLNEDLYDDRTKNRLHTDLVSLREDLERCGLRHILYVNNNEYAVIVDGFYCDYYDLLEGNRDNVKDDPSTYMADYEWAVSRKAFLENKYYGGQ